MYSCGLRISEAVKVEVGHVDSANRLLHIVGKGNKERRVPLAQPVLADLRQLWKVHRHPRWLFPNRDGGGHVAIDVVGGTFREAAAEAGLPARVTPHVLRHSYATRLLENGVDIRVVQILLGHANITSTAIYTHLTEPTRESLRKLLDTIMTGL